MKIESENKENVRFSYKEKIVLDELNTDENLLWFDEANYNIIDDSRILKIFGYNYLSIVVFFLFITFFVLTINFIFFEININALYVSLTCLIIFSYPLYQIIKINKNIYHTVHGFGFSNKKLILIRSQPAGDTYFLVPFFSNINEITSIQNLNLTNGEFVKFRIDSVFYDFSSNKKRIINNLTSREVFLDEKGLEILTNLIKEQAPNAKIII